MLRPPTLSSAPRYPLTVGVSVLATVVSVAWWFGCDESSLFMGLAWWQGQPWRLITSALPHVNFVHLAFNLYWLWAFGTLLEQRLGRLKMGGALLLFAAGSAAAEYAFLQGGVGLSGVVYGLFGFLWVAGRRDPRFAGAADYQTIVLFVGWFFLCIAMTIFNIMPIGNIAHGAGAILGAMLGLAFVTRGARRGTAAAAIAITIVSLGILASIARPYVNFSDTSGAELAYEAYQALTAGDNEKAAGSR